MKNKIIGECGLDPQASGCGEPITKNRLSIFNEKIKKIVKDEWKDNVSVIGVCRKCKHDLIREEITDEEVLLIIDI